jgi:hypothetical protein
LALFLNHLKEYKEFGSIKSTNIYPTPFVVRAECAGLQKSRCLQTKFSVTVVET